MKNQSEILITNLKYAGVCALMFLVVILMVVFSGCEGEEKFLNYKKGDIVYLKPDSTKGVIIELRPTNHDYRIDIGKSERGLFRETIILSDEELIY